MRAVYDFSHNTRIQSLTLIHPSIHPFIHSFIHLFPRSYVNLCMGRIDTPIPPMQISAHSYFSPTLSCMTVAQYIQCSRPQRIL